jgi:hypothetical protein
MDAPARGPHPGATIVGRRNEMDAKSIAGRYLDAWNETDPDVREAAIAALWAEDARYVDPLTTAEGREEVATLIGAVQEQVPGHVFRLVDDEVDAHHNVMRFSWELVPAAGGESVVIGFDVAVLDDEGRIGSVLGFLDKAPAA